LIYESATQRAAQWASDIVSAEPAVNQVDQFREAERWRHGLLAEQLLQRETRYKQTPANTNSRKIASVRRSVRADLGETEDFATRFFHRKSRAPLPFGVEDGAADPSGR
jgi:hypothetical protein